MNEYEDCVQLLTSHGITDKTQYHQWMLMNHPDKNPKNPEMVETVQKVNNCKDMVFDNPPQTRETQDTRAPINYPFDILNNLLEKIQLSVFKFFTVSYGSNTYSLIKLFNHYNLNNYKELQLKLLQLFCIDIDSAATFDMTKVPDQHKTSLYAFNGMTYRAFYEAYEQWKKTKSQGGAGDKHKHKGRMYKVHIGKRGGRYIVVGKQKQKVYIDSNKPK
jgi:hypothetical protein